MNSIYLHYILTQLGNMVSIYFNHSMRELNGFTI